MLNVKENPEFDYADEIFPMMKELMKCGWDCICLYMQVVNYSKFSK